VREDYSPDGKAWGYFPHEHARSRAYRWNEDGLGGICDRHQYLCFALSLWNRRDAFLKERAFGLTGLFGSASPSAFTKDAFHRYIVNDERTAPNPDRKGTKAAARYSRTIPSGGTLVLQLRLTAWQTKTPQGAPFSDFDAIFAQRKKEADEFYDEVLPGSLSADEKLVAGQGYAGMLWPKQYYHYVVTDWLDGDPGQRHPSEHGQSRGQIVDAHPRTTCGGGRPSDSWSLGRRSADRRQEQLHCNSGRTPFALCHADQGAEQRHGGGRGGIEQTRS
jgi:hypothetical protein